MRQPVDYAALAEVLAALSYGARLELLDLLRFPHTAGEIRLTPQRTLAGENPDRPASKQAVQAHLDRLVDTGLVRVETVGSDARGTNRYVVNAQRFYAVTEDLRLLNVRYAGRGGVGDATGTLGSASESEETRGPRLSLAHGVYEGKVFPLAPADERWTIGRHRSAAVSLDYDPYVSMEHAIVARIDGAYHITDVRDSKNGTMVNWRLVPKGGSRALRAGDIVGVGRSMLVFALD
jgi:hypothetical protein